MTTAAKQAKEIPRILFDGYAVLQELRKDPRCANRTSAENVSDVLDAVVRLLRAELERRKP